MISSISNHLNYDLTNSMKELTSGLSQQFVAGSQNGRNFEFLQSKGKLLLIGSIVIAILLSIGLLFKYFSVDISYFNGKLDAKKIITPGSSPRSVPSEALDKDSESPLLQKVKQVDIQRLIDEMERTMGPHLHLYQKETLKKLFNASLKNPFPRKALESLINQKINQQDGWGDEKAQHIRKNLLHLMPVSLSANGPMSRVKEIASTPINSQGDCLVCFYKKGPTEFLGNFATCPSGLTNWGHQFQCLEAAFQWRKYSWAAMQNSRNDMLNDPKMREFFTCDGEQAFRLRQYFDQNYPKMYVQNWQNGVRDEVMWDALQEKFSQNLEFAQLLQDTADAYLLEHNEAKRDDYWSDNHDGSGKNMLGKMLMAIRDNKPQPLPDADQTIIRKFANYANQAGALGYQIF